MGKVKNHSKQNVETKKPFAVVQDDFDDFKLPESQVITEKAPQWSIDIYYAIRRFIFFITFRPYRDVKDDDDED